MRVRYMRVKHMRSRRMRIRGTLYSPIFEFTWKCCFHFRKYIRETFEMISLRSEYTLQVLLKMLINDSNPLVRHSIPSLPVSIRAVLSLLSAERKRETDAQSRRIRRGRKKRGKLAFCRTTAGFIHEPVLQRNNDERTTSVPDAVERLGMRL